MRLKPMFLQFSGLPREITKYSSFHLADAKFYRRIAFIEKWSSHFQGHENLYRKSSSRLWSSSWIVQSRWSWNSFCEIHWTLELMFQSEYDIWWTESMNTVTLNTYHIRFNEKSNVMYSREYQHDIILNE